MTIEEWTHPIEEPKEGSERSEESFLVRRDDSVVTDSSFKKDGAYDLLDSMHKNPGKTIYSKEEIIALFGELPDHDDLDNIIIRNKLITTLDKIDTDLDELSTRKTRLESDPYTDPKELRNVDNSIKVNINLRLQILQMLDKHNSRNKDRKSVKKIEHTHNKGLSPSEIRDFINVTPND